VALGAAPVAAPASDAVPGITPAARDHRMRLATSTNLFAMSAGFDAFSASDEALRRCSAAGFRVIDMNFCRLGTGMADFDGPDWRQSALRLRSLADSLGLEFSQSHLPFYPKLEPVEIPARPGFRELFREMLFRGLEASAILGVRWAIVHPFMAKAGRDLDEEASLELNLSYYEALVERAGELGLGLAFENMPEHRPDLRRRYCASAPELCRLIDAFRKAFGSELVGACWDFGHGAILYPDQTKALTMVGERLKATHVADNPGGYDAHTLPFFEGSVDWPAVMRSLVEIGYRGDFALEVHGMTTYAPDQVKDSIARFCRSVGEYCLSICR
jgi:L-ribulose-5-phosphate 3-epimerase